jgi:hypothetical protein
MLTVTKVLESVTDFVGNLYYILKKHTLKF